MSCFGHDPNRISLEILKNARNLMAKFQLEISPNCHGPFFISRQCAGFGQVDRGGAREPSQPGIPSGSKLRTAFDVYES